MNHAHWHGVFIWSRPVLSETHHPDGAEARAPNAKLQHIERGYVCAWYLLASNINQGGRRASIYIQILSSRARSPPRPNEEFSEAGLSEYYISPCISEEIGARLEDALGFVIFHSETLGTRDSKREGWNDFIFASQICPCAQETDSSGSALTTSAQHAPAHS